MKKIHLMMILLVFLLPACGPKTPKTATPGPEAIYTSAAQTVAVQLTQNAENFPSATPTNTVTPLPPTNTQPAATVSAPSATLQVTVPSALPVTNDLVEFIDNNPADGTVFAPGESFTVTWTLKNAGKTTWTTSYELRFYSGDRMGSGSNSYSFPQAIAPGQTLTISTQFTAPSKAGEYKSIWVLTNADGQNFYPVYTVIKVGSATVTATTGASNTVAPSATATAEVTPGS